MGDSHKQTEKGRGCEKVVTGDCVYEGSHSWWLRREAILPKDWGTQFQASLDPTPSFSNLTDTLYHLYRLFIKVGGLRKFEVEIFADYFKFSSM